MALSKIVIKNTDEGNEVHAQFNPKEYSISKSTTWVEYKVKGKDVPSVHFTTGQRRELKMELFFDTSISKDNVSIEVKKLEAFMLMMDNKSKKRPPLLFVSWGEKSLHFKCVLEQMGQRYTMFTENGTPIRAIVTVTFKEISSKQKKSFGGSKKKKKKTVKKGEHILCVCEPTAESQKDWRSVATPNGVDDPLHPSTEKEMSMP